MRFPRLILPLLLLAPPALATEAAQAGGWTPTRQQIATLEKSLTFPAGTELAKFRRTYAGVTQDGVRVIRGWLLLAPPGQASLMGPAGLFIVDQANLPAVMDGGCKVVRVNFNPATNKGEARCNGGR